MIGVKKIIAHFIANISNLLLHVNIDIILFANGLFHSFNVARDNMLMSGNNEKSKKNVKIAKIAFLGRLLPITSICQNNILGNRKYL